MPSLLGRPAVGGKAWWRRAALGQIAAAIATLIGACASQPATVASPAPCEPRLTFHVVVHGWHSGVVVRAADLATRLPGLAFAPGSDGWLELGWGDAAFYQAESPTATDALRAVLYPTDAVVHAVPIPGSDVAGFVPAGTVITLTVPASGYQRVLDHLVETFARGPDGGLVTLGPGLYGGGRFYRARGSFHALNTCNTWVARAVAASGYPLESTGIVTAGALLEGLRRDSESRCHTAR